VDSLDSHPRSSRTSTVQSPRNTRLCSSSPMAEESMEPARTTRNSTLSPTTTSPRGHRGTSVLDTATPTSNTSAVLAEHDAAFPYYVPPTATFVPAQGIPIDEAYELDDTDSEDGDSALDAGSSISDTTSLYSDIMKYRFENGRRYMATRMGNTGAPTTRSRRISSTLRTTCIS
jgi:hypothetical protein